LDGYTNQVHVAETARECRSTCRRAEDEYKTGAHDGCSKVYNAVRQPCHEIQKGTLVRREYVAEVRTIEDVLKGWEDFDPYRRSPFAWNEPARKVSSDANPFTSRDEWEGRDVGDLPTGIEEDEPSSYREER
jgi:hypothetical protein